MSVCIPQVASNPRVGFQAAGGYNPVAPHPAGRKSAPPTAGHSGQYFIPAMMYMDRVSFRNWQDASLVC